MNTKFRALYLSLGFILLAVLIYHLINAFPEFNPGSVLLIAVPDVVLFFLAYRTYPPVENNLE